MIKHYNGQFREIEDIFHASVHETASSYYTSDQLKAWAPIPINYEASRARCEFKRPFLYCDETSILGFIELDTDGHIDRHYVHPKYNRMGVGGALLAHVMQVAKEVGLSRLHVECSYLAKGLYLKNGFNVVSKNIFSIDSVTIENWLMDISIV